MALMRVCRSMISVIGSLLHKTSIEIFCRVFYALYSGAGENIDVIKMAAEACGNKYMEHQIKNVAIPLMVEKGAGITEAFEASGVFTKTAISRLHSGAETGTVKNTALQLAEYYEKFSILHRIDGNRDREAVFSDISRLIEENEGRCRPFATLVRDHHSH